MFIMIDGIDGSGKSSIVAFWKKHLASQGKKIFDAVAFQKETGRLPEKRDWHEADVIISGEPTYAGIGKVIREELISNKNNYPTLAIAESYGLDRLVLYTKLILPARQAGKIIIQDRGVSTSLVYQVLTDKKITQSTIAKLPGNDLALTNAPDHLVILRVSVKTALARLSGRTGKKDDSIFERGTLLKKASAGFVAPHFERLFKKRKTQIHHLPAEAKIAILEPTAIALLNKMIAG